MPAPQHHPKPREVRQDGASSRCRRARLQEEARTQGVDGWRGHRVWVRLHPLLGVDILVVNTFLRAMQLRHVPFLAAAAVLKTSHRRRER